MVASMAGRSRIEALGCSDVGMLVEIVSDVVNLQRLLLYSDMQAPIALLPKIMPIPINLAYFSVHECRPPVCTAANQTNLELGGSEIPLA